MEFCRRRTLLVLQSIRLCTQLSRRYTSIPPLRLQHEELFQSLSKTLHIKSHEDWYNIGPDEIKVASSKANTVLHKYYKGSFIKAITTVFPEYKWELWRFTKERLPTGFWLEKKNQV